MNDIDNRIDSLQQHAFGRGLRRWNVMREAVSQAMKPLSDAFWGPPIESCTACGHALKGDPNPLAICHSCFEQIPWIIHVRCPVCGRAEDCPDCRRGYERYFRHNRSAVKYNDQMREWLARYKYRGDEQYAKVLGTMLYHAYVSLLLVIEAEREKPVVPREKNSETCRRAAPPLFQCITFVPISEERLMERGFNQAEKLALELAKYSGLPVISLLHRTRATAKQSMKTRTERFNDLRGAFALDEQGMQQLMRAAPEKDNSRIRILLIDDVYTTGSTINQCSAVIRQRFPVDIYSLTWAR